MSTHIHLSVFNRRKSPAILCAAAKIRLDNTTDGTPTNRDSVANGTVGDEAFIKPSVHVSLDNKRSSAEEENLNRVKHSDG